MGDEGVESLISRFQSERTVEAKEAILFDITQHHPEAGRPLLDVARETNDPDTKWLAIRGLGQLKYQPAMQFLISSLSSSHRYVRANAARALGELRANSAKSELLGLLKNEQDNGVIEQTALAVEMLKVSEAVPALRARADNVSNAQTQCWLIGAIAVLGNKSNAPFIAKRLYVDDPTVGMCAAGALQQLTGEDLRLGFHEGPISPSDIISKAKLWWEQNASRWK
jgi:hypothetical protein